MNKTFGSIVRVCIFTVGICLMSTPGMGASSAPLKAGSSPGKGGGKIVNRASLIIEREVENAQGEHMGMAKDLIIGEKGCVSYLVLLRGSAFGIEETLIPIPWRFVILQESDKPVLLNLNHEDLRQAPGFPLEEWPDFLPPSKVEQIKKYYENKK